jgi:hypothetical protein
MIGAPSLNLRIVGCTDVVTNSDEDAGAPVAAAFGVGD